MDKHAKVWYGIHEGHILAEGVTHYEAAAAVCSQEEAVMLEQSSGMVSPFGAIIFLAIIAVLGGILNSKGLPLW